MAVTINASTSAGLVQTADLSGSLALQANGTTVATASSSGLAISTYNPSASLITSGTSQASTSGTSIDFTSIPSWVKRITVMFNGVSTNSSTDFLIQIGAGSIDTASYISTSMLIRNAGVAPESSTSGYVIGSYGASFNHYGHMFITSFGSNIWIATHSIIEQSMAAIFAGGGVKTLSGTLDRVRLTTVSGTATFDAGSINILYE